MLTAAKVTQGNNDLVLIMDDALHAQWKLNPECVSYEESRYH
uniref:Uncharacterized protein n=1 Tax=Arundo donax TaxID=35708 RepID=A0A0A9CEX3_ARUDO